MRAIKFVLLFAPVVFANRLPTKVPVSVSVSTTPKKPNLVFNDVQLPDAYHEGEDSSDDEYDDGTVSTMSPSSATKKPSNNTRTTTKKPSNVIASNNATEVNMKLLQYATFASEKLMPFMKPKGEGMAMRGLSLTRITARTPVNESIKAEYRQAIREIYEGRPRIAKKVIQNMNRSASGSLTMRSLAAGRPASFPCGERVKIEACNLFMKANVNPNKVFLLNTVVDRIDEARNAELAATNPYNNIKDLCDGRKAKIYGSKQEVCLDADMLIAISSFADTFYAKNGVPLNVKSLASGDQSGRGPSFSHRLGASVDFMCLNFRGNGSNGEEEQCGQIADFCIKYSRKMRLAYFANFTYYPMSFPAEEWGCDAAQYAYADSVHCTLGIGGLPAAVEGTNYLASDSDKQQVPTARNRPRFLHPSDHVDEAGEGIED